MVSPSERSASRAVAALGVAVACVVAVAAGAQVLGPPATGGPSPDGTAPAPATPAAPSPATPVATSTPTRPTTATDAPDRARRYEYAIGRGADRTAVHVYDSGRPGPTAVVVGGQHGTEPAGWLAARDVANWSVERGGLVVVPEANPRAIGAGTRLVDGRDLNRQFPVGARPTGAQARAIWSVVLRHDADLVVDLHSSRGTYRVDGVGQAVFPTVTGDAVANAAAAIDRVNRQYDLEGDHAFRLGNVMGRSGTKLARKVAGDLDEPAYIVETSRRETVLEVRVEWTTAVTRELLRLHGLVTGGLADRTGSSATGTADRPDAVESGRRRLRSPGRASRRPPGSRPAVVVDPPGGRVTPRPSGRDRRVFVSRSRRPPPFRTPVLGVR
jgi:predicted deacylase